MRNLILTFKIFIIFFYKISDMKIKKNFFILILLSNLNSISELLTLAVVLPFLYILVNNVNSEMTLPLIDLNFLQSFFHVSDDNLIILVFIVLVISIILSFIFRFLFVYFTSLFTQKLNLIISNNILRSWLTMEYLEFKNNNSSDLIAGITQKGIQVGACSNSLLFIINNLFILSYLAIFLILLNPLITISIIFILLIIIIFINIFTNVIIKRNSISISENQSLLVKKTIDISQLFKTIIIEKKLNFFLKIHKNIADRVFFKKAINNILILSPKIIIESVFLLFICSLAFLIYKKNSELLANLIPLLAIYLYSLQRFLPLLSQIFQHISALSGNFGNLQDVRDLTKFEQLGNYESEETLLFNESIVLKNINFSYANKNIINDLNLKIKKSDYVYILGPSGSGKTTLIEILIGLLIPSSGSILVDGVKINEKNKLSWFDKISYISQKNYFLDSGIDENITFSSQLDIDQNKLDKIKNIIGINDSNFGRKIEEINSIGESGNNLSGGQLQRISLARSLYKNPEILIIDEGTSQLDTDAEYEILTKIREEFVNTTIIHITHRNTNPIENSVIFKLNEV